MRQHGRVLVVALLALMYLPIAALHGHPELLDAATKAFQQIPAGVHSQLIELPAAIDRSFTVGGVPK